MITPHGGDALDEPGAGPPAGGLTHAGVYDLYPTPGLVRPVCPGPVAVLWTRPDPAGPNGPRLVRLYRCGTCLTRLPVDLNARAILNAYVEPGDAVRGLVKELAARKETMR